MKNKKSLNRIIEDYQRIEIEIMNNEGLLDSDLERMLEINELELESKLDGHEKFIRYLKSQVEYLKNMEHHYYKKRKTLENSIDKSRESMFKAMETFNKKKIKTLEFSYSLNETEKWDIDIEKINNEQIDDLISKELGEKAFKPYINKIKLEYKGKDIIPDWIIVSKNKHIKSV